MYKKRDGTSGILGQLYETKLLSLIYFRAKHKNNIHEIHLATNVDKVGAFDDICFRVKIQGFDRPLSVFIQAKHRENDSVVTLTKKAELIKYFDSYLTIKRKFKVNNEDVLFDGEFDESECLFVIYTTAKESFKYKSVDSKAAYILNDLLDTGGNAIQPLCENQDVDILCEVALQEQISSLAKQLTKYLFGEADFQNMLDDELIFRYHVVIAEKIMRVSEIQPEGHRLAYFSDDFFDNNEEFVMLFRQRLFTEILKRRKGDKNAHNHLTLLYNDPSAAKLSVLIGNVITCSKNGNLEFIDKQTPEDLKLKLNKVYLSQSTIDNAVTIAAKSMLVKQKFKVPASFGNKDLTIRGNDAKIEKRLDYLTSVIFNLLKESDASNMVVTIDESLDKGFLKLNGGIASAVGNVLVLDKNTKLMKFTDKGESLGKLARRLFEKLKIKIDNVQQYRFEVKVKKFPKLSFNCSDHDLNLLKDFLEKLIFYTEQANEGDVEEILKNEIQEYQCNNGDHFRVRSDAIFLKYHDMVQKWWKLPKEGPYLTKDIETFDDIIKSVVVNPLSSVLNVIYGIKVKNFVDYRFEIDSVSALKLNDLVSTIVVTQSTALTAAKVIQYFKNEDYIVLDLEYLINLSINYSNALCNELKNTNKNKKLVIICSNVLNSRKLSKTIENIIKYVNDRIVIVITNANSLEVIKHYFPKANLVNDRRNNLIDLNAESQQIILNNTRIVFQGVEVGLNLIVDNESMTLAEAHVLEKILCNETIIVGKSLSNPNYEEIKHLYVERLVDRGNRKKPIEMNTLNDITDDVVLITAKPGMGKSTLLTHLSLKTQELNTKVWIVRINLLDHATEFNIWQNNKTLIDTLKSLTFMCQVVLGEKYAEINKTIVLEEVNGVLNLKSCNGDESIIFELKMFLNYFNNKRIIFIFDGFDEICPHYANEVIQLLKTVKNYSPKHKMWIASRSYNKIKSILQHEFGTSYELQHLNRNNQGQYLEKFWKSNLILNELDSAQLDNLDDFLKFMFENIRADTGTEFVTLKKLQVLPLHYIYRHAFNYLKNEIKNGDNWLYKNKFHEAEIHEFLAGFPIQEYNGHIYDMEDMCNFLGTPLHLFLLADYFLNEIKDVSKTTNKWNLDVNTFTIYKRFLETKLKKIRFQEKNKMEVSNPDIRITYEKECSDFIIKHKKMAAYAMFYKDIPRMLSRKDLKEVKDMIKFIKQGGEKTGVVYRVAPNNIPIFVHRTFAEYFAVEYFCDLLKNEKRCEIQQSMMYFLINVMFFKSPANILNIMDSKLKIDNALMAVLEKNDNVIFDLLTEQTKVVRESRRESYLYYYYDNDLGSIYEPKNESSLYRAVSENLRTFVVLFNSIFNKYLNNDNLDDFIDIIHETEIISTAIKVNCEEFLMFAIDIVKKIDILKLRLLLLDVRYFPLLNYGELSNENILNILRICVLNQTSANDTIRGSRICFPYGV